MKMKVVYKREKWWVVVLGLVLMGSLAYLGYSWILWFFLVFLSIAENFNRPTRTLHYKDKEDKKKQK